MTTRQAEHPVAIDRYDGDGFTLCTPLNASAQAVWSAWAQPAARAAWWRPGIELDLQIGGEFAEPWTDPAGNTQVTRGRVQACAEQRILLLSWADEGWCASTEVEISIEPVPGHDEDVVLVLSHDGFAPIMARSQEDLVGAHLVGWRRHLKRLKQYVEGT